MHSGIDKVFLPPTDNRGVRWIPTATWTKVEVERLVTDKCPKGMYGRIIERSRYILFEDERDATMFKLTL